MAVIRIGNARNMTSSIFSAKAFMVTSFLINDCMFSLLVSFRGYEPGVINLQYKCTPEKNRKHGRIRHSKKLVDFCYTFRKTYA
jgi:hypothetical protein